MARRSGLGKGLGALIPPSTGEAESAYQQLPVSSIQPNPSQPRKTFDEEALVGLTASVREIGVLQPVLVRPLAEEGYVLIAGERRWRAAKRAGLQLIPALVRTTDDTGALQQALVENIQRENLNPLEEARALERLIKEFELTHQEAADAVGRSRAGVSNLLRLLELAAEVSALIEKREIEMGHARALLALTNRRQQIEVAALVAKKGLSVRETEALVRRMQEPAAEREVRSAPRDPNVHRLEQELADKLGAKVAIQHSAGGKGRLVVSYNSLDELDGILAHIQ